MSFLCYYAAIVIGQFTEAYRYVLRGFGGRIRRRSPANMSDEDSVTHTSGNYSKRRLRVTIREILIFHLLQILRDALAGYVCQR